MGFGFQFTLPRGERLIGVQKDINLNVFQFTLPRGERRRWLHGGWFRRCFNSRSRGGSDRRWWIFSAFIVGFNSRSRGGSDSLGYHGGARGPCFNSRSRGGSDSALPFRAYAMVWFQFTLPRGERPMQWFGTSGSAMFQFTLPRGERHLGDEHRGRHRGFNSRSRGGSDSALRSTYQPPLVSIHAPAGGATCKAFFCTH